MTLIHRIAPPRKVAKRRWSPGSLGHVRVEPAGHHYLPFFIFLLFDFVFVYCVLPLLLWT